MGIVELGILIVGLSLFAGVAYYGCNTVLGFLGTLLMAIFTTPIIAFIVVYCLKRNSRNKIKVSE